MKKYNAIMYLAFVSMQVWLNFMKEIKFIREKICEKCAGLKSFSFRKKVRFLKSFRNYSVIDLLDLSENKRYLGVFNGIESVEV